MSDYKRGVGRIYSQSRGCGARKIFSQSVCPLNKKSWRRHCKVYDKILEESHCMGRFWLAAAFCLIYFEIIIKACTTACITGQIPLLVFWFSITLYTMLYTLHVSVFYAVGTWWQKPWKELANIKAERSCWWAIWSCAGLWILHSKHSLAAIWITFV